MTGRAAAFVAGAPGSGSSHHGGMSTPPPPVSGKRTWVVVADGARARIFETAYRGDPLRPALDHDLVSASLHGHDRHTDRPGRVHDRQGAHRHGMEHPSDPVREDERRLAKSVATELGRAPAEGIARIVLVAPPETLGDLRAALPDPIRAMVVAEVGKDLAAMKDHELEERLRDTVWSA